MEAALAAHGKEITEKEAQLAAILA